MRDLSRDELQEVVFLTKSKKAFATYLGIDVTEVNELWSNKGLKLPTDWLREKKKVGHYLSNQLALHGSYNVMAKRYGVSPSFLRTLMEPSYLKPLNDLEWDEEGLVYNLTRYKSVRLTARCCNVTEGAVRKLAKRLGVELAPLLDYTLSEHSNSKGRRAELDYAAIRKTAIRPGG